MSFAHQSEDVTGVRTVLRRFIIGFLIFLCFAILWGLTYDTISGTKQAQREKYRNYLECLEIARRVELFYATNKAFPTNIYEVVNLPTDRVPMRSASILQTNYSFRFAEAQRAVAAGRTNVPVIFEKIHLIKGIRGGLVGFVFPPKAHWYDEQEYQVYWKD